MVMSSGAITVLYAIFHLLSDQVQEKTENLQGT